MLQKGDVSLLFLLGNERLKSRWPVSDGGGIESRITVGMPKVLFSFEDSDLPAHHSFL